MPGFFITGTDTGVGKTWATVALMRFLKAEGLTVIGMKPVASGCFRQDGEWRNDDALMLLENASFSIDYAKLNIYAFEQPVAPHIAAQTAGQLVQVETIVEQFLALEGLADCVLVEGVGGWEVPLNDRDRVSDLARALKIPVILVIAMKLGCLNHALLTHDAMVRSGVACAGWVANCVLAELPRLEENLDTLKSRLSFPCLGVIPYGAVWDESVPKYFKRADFFNCRMLRNLA